MYKEDLKSKNWQRRRLEVLSRDNFQCQSASCNRKCETLDVHHLFYLDYIKPWLYPTDLLITLCTTCHNKEHKCRTRHEQDLYTALLQKGFLFSDIVALTTLIYTNEYFLKDLIQDVKKIQSNHLKNG